MRLLILLFVINSIACQAWSEPTLILVEGVNNDSSKYKGRLLRAGTGHRLSETFDLEATVDDLERTYPGDAKIRDAIFAANLISRVGRNVYLENSVSKSTESSIFAVWSTRAGVHYAFGNEDFGLNFRYDEFQRSLDGVVIPSYFHSFSERFGVGASIFAVRTDSWNSAYQIQIVTRMTEHDSLRLFGATGRTIEDAGLVAEFRAYTARYLYDIGTHWQVGASYTDYWSAVRSEHSIGLILGYK